MNDNTSHMIIPLFNKNKDNIYNTIVDADKFEELSKYNWCYTFTGRNSYVVTYVENEHITMHSYLLGKKSNMVIDHINGDSLDNRIENLRFVSYSLNNQNKIKRDGTTSKYIGVSLKSGTNDVWVSANSNKLLGYFKDEKYAALVYDKYVIFKYGYEARTNFDKKIIDDFGYDITIWDVEIEKNIYKQSDNFLLKYNGIVIGTFKKLEDAQNAKKNYDSNKQFIKLEKYKNNIIQVNNDNIPYILISHKDGRDNDTCYVDEDKWHELSIYSWTINSAGYVQGRVNGITITMHKFLLSTESTDIIDHINGNKLDNRMSNLRKSTSTLNNHNVRKRINTSSIYKGVSKKHNSSKYRAQINKDKKSYLLGYFETEKEAAIAYNKKALELYGEFASINIIID